MSQPQTPPLITIKVAVQAVQVLAEVQAVQLVGQVTQLLEPRRKVPVVQAVQTVDETEVVLVEPEQFVQPGKILPQVQQIGLPEVET